MKGRNRSGSFRTTAWYRVYRERMHIGLERCRYCERLHCVDNPLRFAHIVPHSAGGRYNLSNVTIMCRECDIRQANTLWDWQVSLAEEERTAPPDRRWAERAGARTKPGETATVGNRT